MYTEAMTKPNTGSNEESQKALDLLEKSIMKIRKIRTEVSSNTRDIWHKKFTQKILDIVSELDSLAS